MTDWIGAILLLCGAALCLLAAAGVLRLPDFFMRMHAATKAGVVGCGLVLLGVGFAHGTAATWIKIAAAIFFLILTTPVAGHLLGRAAFVGGAPFRRGTPPTRDSTRSCLAAASTPPLAIAGRSAMCCSRWPAASAPTRRSTRRSRSRGSMVLHCAAWRSSTSRVCRTSARYRSAPAGTRNRCASAG